MLESKHRIIRSIFLRLKNANESTPIALLAYQATVISNDLYGSDTVTAFELAKGYTKPIESEKAVVPLPDDLRAAHDELVAKRKLNLILRSHSTSTPPL